MGVPVMGVLAWLYAKALPLLSLPALLVPVVSFFFAMACCIAVMSVVEKGHSRSIAASTVMAILLCLAFIWIHWVVIFGAMGEAARFAFNNPWAEAQMLWDLATADYKKNPRMLAPVTRCVTWVAETGFFMSLMVFFACFETRTPYSEAVHCWAKKEKIGELLPGVGDAEALVKELAAQRIAPLLRMACIGKQQLTMAASEWCTLRLTGYTVENHSQEYWVNLEWLIHQRENNGKVKVQTKELLRAWILTHDEYAALLHHLNTGYSSSPPSSSETEEDTASSQDAEKDPIPQELEPAFEAYKAGDFDEAIARANPYRKHSEEFIRTDALRLCALGKSEQKRWAEAYADFNGLFELEPSVHNAVQLATTSVMAGELLRGEDWFKRADEMNFDRNEIPPAKLRTAFLSALKQAGEFTAGKPHIDWLTEGYRTLSITDSTFLFIRGFPFFSVFLEKSLPFLQASLSDAEVRILYENLRQDVDPEGQAAIDAFLKASGYN
ncbi:MAG: hypothetical protein FWD67_00950 [Betaproteobacteria bacterium]|nr:hypothetical protein [Betaproteobacteria bacterium]